MPTVHREAGFQFRIYPDDHESAHVHVWKAGAVAKILLGGESERPESIDPGEMSTPDVRRAVRIVEARQSTLLAEWRKYHA